MATLEQIGTIFGGFGAGVQGRGGEFLKGQQSRRAEKQRLSQDRKAKMLEDITVLNEVINVRGDAASGVRFLNTRLDEINRLGGDDTQTRAFRDGLLSTDPAEQQEVRSGVADIVDRARIIASAGAVQPSALEQAKTGKLLAETAQIGKDKGAKGAKFIGTPSRTTRDGRNFLTGVVQRQDGTFGIEEIEVAGDFVSIIGETGEALAQRKIKVAEGKEQVKLKQQLKFKPLIEKSVRIAEAKAKAEGEAFTDLKRSRAALPGLLETVSQLRELAPIATSTLLGKAFDFAVKETGFTTTKGADARAKFIAIINNQVLPLLKPTFGAAFTEREGEALKATMGDPDASPSQKLEQLQAFIDQKIRDVQGGERELGEAVTPAAQLTSGIKFLGFE